MIVSMAVLTLMGSVMVAMTMLEAAWTSYWVLLIPVGGYAWIWWKGL